MHVLWGNLWWLRATHLWLVCIVRICRRGSTSLTTALSKEFVMEGQAFASLKIRNQSLPPLQKNPFLWQPKLFGQENQGFLRLVLEGSLFSCRVCTPPLMQQSEIPTCVEKADCKQVSWGMTELHIYHVYVGVHPKWRQQKSVFQFGTDWSM